MKKKKKKEEKLANKYECMVCVFSLVMYICIFASLPSLSIAKEREEKKSNLN